MQAAIGAQAAHKATQTSLIHDLHSRSDVADLRVVLQRVLVRALHAVERVGVGRALVRVQRRVLDVIPAPQVQSSATVKAPG